MSLVDLVDNTITDKNQAYVYKYEPGLPRGHTYLPLYEELFNKKKGNGDKYIGDRRSTRGQYKIMGRLF